MKKLKIKPAQLKLQLQMELSKIGGLDTSSANSIQERATVIDVGDEAKQLGWKIGDDIFVKAWGIDIITYQGEKYYFIDCEIDGYPNPAICAVIIK